MLLPSPAYCCSLCHCSTLLQQIVADRVFTCIGTVLMVQYAAWGLQVQDGIMQHMHSLLTRILHLPQDAMPPGTGQRHTASSF